MASQESRSKNPFGELQSTGGQWAEARAFMRTYGGNPYAQARLVSVLAGVFKNAAEGWQPNPNVKDGVEVQVVADAAKVLIRYIREQLPEWASTETVVLDRDFVLEDYPGCDPHLKWYIETVILEDDFDNGGVE